MPRAIPHTWNWWILALQIFYAANIVLWGCLIVRSFSFNVPSLEIWAIQICFGMALVVSLIGLYGVVKDVK